MPPRPSQTEPGRCRYALPSPSQEAIAAGLHIVATPIGNLRDITLRALHTLAAADAIACEDTRMTHKLLAAYGIRTKLISYNEHNAERMRAPLLARLEAGDAIALVSDAGTPLISDPGFKLVREARKRGLPVFTVPGPSSVIAAVSVAGLPSDAFFFAGFLPAKQAARAAMLAALRTVPATLIFLESPRRVAAALHAIAEHLGDREIAVARELTKLYEEVRRGSAGDLAAHYREHGDPKGEIVLLVHPPAGEQAASDTELDAALRAALCEHSVKDAAALVAKMLKLPRQRVYTHALALAKPSR